MKNFDARPDAGSQYYKRIEFVVSDFTSHYKDELRSHTIKLLTSISHAEVPIVSMTNRRKKNFVRSQI